VVIPGRDGHNVLDWRRSFWFVQGVATVLWVVILGWLILA
jgi:hypothetical protein